MSKSKQVSKQTKTSIVDAIYKKTIEIRGFGTFSVQFRKGRKGMRNPKTGESVDTQDHSVVVFRPGKILSSAVRPIVEKDA